MVTPQISDRSRLRGVANVGSGPCHPLTDRAANQHLQTYEANVKGSFELIVPLLKRISALQHDQDFVSKSQSLARSELGFDLPSHLLEQAWVRALDMRALFAWCVFQSHQQVSDRFFQEDPLQGGEGSIQAKHFQSFLVDCGFISLMSPPALMDAWHIRLLMPYGFHLVQ